MEEILKLLEDKIKTAQQDIQKSVESLSKSLDRAIVACSGKYPSKSLVEHDSNYLEIVPAGEPSYEIGDIEETALSCFNSKEYSVSGVSPPIECVCSISAEVLVEGFLLEHPTAISDVVSSTVPIVDKEEGILVWEDKNAGTSDDIKIISSIPVRAMKDKGMYLHSCVALIFVWEPGPITRVVSRSHTPLWDGSWYSYSIYQCVVAIFKRLCRHQLSRRAAVFTVDYEADGFYLAFGIMDSELVLVADEGVLGDGDSESIKLIDTSCSELVVETLENLAGGYVGGFHTNDRFSLVQQRMDTVFPNEGSLTDISLLVCIIDKGSPIVEIVSCDDQDNSSLLSDRYRAQKYISEVLVNLMLDRIIAESMWLNIGYYRELTVCDPSDVYSLYQAMGITKKPLIIMLHTSGKCISNAHNVYVIGSVKSTYRGCSRKEWIQIDNLADFTTVICSKFPIVPGFTPDIHVVCDSHMQLEFQTVLWAFSNLSSYECLQLLCNVCSVRKELGFAGSYLVEMVGSINTQQHNITYSRVAFKVLETHPNLLMPYPYTKESVCVKLLHERALKALFAVNIDLYIQKTKVVTVIAHCFDLGGSAIGFLSVCVSLGQNVKFLRHVSRKVHTLNSARYGYRQIAAAWFRTHVILAISISSAHVNGFQSYTFKDGSVLTGSKLLRRAYTTAVAASVYTTTSIKREGSWSWQSYIQIPLRILVGCQLNLRSSLCIQEPAISYTDQNVLANRIGVVTIRKCAVYAIIRTIACSVRMKRNWLFDPGISYSLILDFLGGSAQVLLIRINHQPDAVLGSLIWRHTYFYLTVFCASKITIRLASESQKRHYLLPFLQIFFSGSIFNTMTVSWSYKSLIPIPPCILVHFQFSIPSPLCLHGYHIFQEFVHFNHSWVVLNFRPLGILWQHSSKVPVRPLIQNGIAFLKLTLHIRGFRKDTSGFTTTLHSSHVPNAKAIPYFLLTVSLYRIFPSMQQYFKMWLVIYSISYDPSIDYSMTYGLWVATGNMLMGELEDFILINKELTYGLLVHKYSDLALPLQLFTEKTGNMVEIIALKVLNKRNLQVNLDGYEGGLGTLFGILLTTVPGSLIIVTLQGIGLVSPQFIYSLRSWTAGCIFVSWIVFQRNGIAIVSHSQLDSCCD